MHSISASQSLPPGSFGNRRRRERDLWQTVFQLVSDARAGDGFQDNTCRPRQRDFFVLGLIHRDHPDSASIAVRSGNVQHSCSTDDRRATP